MTTAGRKRYKFCKKCEQSKPVEDYYVRATGLLECWCKPCNISYSNGLRAEKRRLAREERATRPAPPPPTERECRICGVVKPISEFYKRRQGTYRTECKPCLLAYRAEWYSKPENRAKIVASGQAYADQNRSANRVRKMAKYGLSTAQYDAMYDEQGGACLICSSVKARMGLGGAGRSEVLCVDHDHESGRVRGLLCTSCNGGLGLLGDDVGRLRVAINYLSSGELDG